MGWPIGRSGRTIASVGDEVVQVASMAAVGLALWARVLSSDTRSPRFWLAVAFGLAIAVSSPAAAVLVGVVMLVGVEVRSGLFGLLVASAALAGIGGLIVNSISPAAALVVEVTAVVLLFAGAAVGIGAKQRADGTNRVAVGTHSA